MTRSAMHFDVQRQRDFIAEHGTSVLVFPRVICPCLAEGAGFSPLCPVCKGSGRFYPPGTHYPTTVLPHLESSEVSYTEAGTWVPGVMHVTTLPEDSFGEDDKLRFVRLRMVFQEVLTRGLDDELLFTAGVQVDLVVDRDQAYRHSSDYVFTPPHLITWLDDGNAPAFGAKYSVRYRAFPEYVVSGDNPRMRSEAGVQQSSEVVLRLLSKTAQEML